RAHGIETTTIDDIADALGSTKGRVYHYYRTKNSVLLDVHLAAMDMVMSEVAPLATGEGTAAERFAAMIKANVELNGRELEFFHAAIAMIANGVPDKGRPEELEAAAELVRLRARFEDAFVRVID